jgi:hypothetical protein
MATNDIVMDKVVLRSPSGRRRVALELGDDGIGPSVLDHLIWVRFDQRNFE